MSFFKSDRAKDGEKNGKMVEVYLKRYREIKREREKD